MQGVRGALGHAAQVRRAVGGGARRGQRLDLGEQGGGGLRAEPPADLGAAVVATSQVQLLAGPVAVGLVQAVAGVGVQHVAQVPPEPGQCPGSRRAASVAR